VGNTPASAHGDGSVVSQYASTETGSGLSAPTGIVIHLRLWTQSI
jgi:hypothetical protein